MNLNGICLNKNMSFLGMFEIPDIGYFAGKVLYKQNEQFEIKLFIRNYFKDISPLEKITAILVDDNNKKYFATFFNCEFHSEGFSSATNEYIAYCEYVLLSTERYFNQEQDSLKTANIYIKLWDEFCYPQGYKGQAEYEPTMKSFRLSNKMKISFNQSINAHMLPKDIFNAIFVNFDLTDNEVQNLSTNLKTLLKPYRNKIGIKIIEKHKWFIQVDNISTSIGVNLVSYYLTMLIKCLTYDFGASLEKIEILSNEDYNGKKIPIKFDFLQYCKSIIQPTKYTNLRGCVTLNSFNETEWKTILNNLFKNRQILEKFFDILFANHYEETITEYHLERYIDCISAIGVNKKFSSQCKYESVLKDFVSDFSIEIRDKLLNIFRKNLKNIEIKSNTFKKRKWGRIGKQLSELRALTTHFNETCKVVYMTKYLDIYFILELIIIDYIFELLEINKDKRLEYKLNYLKEFLQTH